ncbi:sulfurtransferase-like selenium metabolism protein YedF [Tissierella pigra]|uniref:Sulfurtransferase-like selenium metabolism protein YedF n=1 Tax=Tissierella pigra TaxID=2607614 RepID=A0A6N7XLM4_9FIRM|nr:sulfurtransferase-like selenium metabolism protein YedF [Tissierella pigra]MBU5428348.1 sulfurtransferase-like selenium metabolism protein YedF [Tissierella pigra]MSU01672.1 sulfurtransferase-like selenium metabolism protein YedF [Tissierella pigra]
MRIEVDARGQLCPKPVIMTKKELDNLAKGVITTIVDNEVARDNVSKLAQSSGCSFIIDKKDEDYYIHITKDGIVEETIGIPTPSKTKDLTIAIGSDKMGVGEEELGKILMKSFIYTIRETTPFPTTILFLNSGVNLTCEDSPVLEDLKELEKSGVEIISCGTCLDYYNLKDKIQVGEIGNMYAIYEKMRNANNTLNIG